jgi:hypothetical protein
MPYYSGMRSAAPVAVMKEIYVYNTLVGKSEEKR